MNPVAIAALDTAITLALKQFMNWQALKSRPAGYVWTDADVNQFLAEIRSNTPEAVEARIRAESQ